MLGTNPIAIAFPGYKEPPIVIDMATSAVAYGKIEIALRKKERIPKGWIIDKDGRDTMNPQDMIDGGAQLPVGSEREMGGHKGYGLASMVDILCCVLSGEIGRASCRERRDNAKRARALDMRCGSHDG